MARDIVKITERGRALVELQFARGRSIVKRIPEPIQVQLGKMSRRSLVLTLEIFAGLFVVGMVLLALAYGRLNQGPVSLSSIVPVMEEAINNELADVRVKIDDAIIQRDPEGAGVNFRLRNIRLVDMQGAVVASAPYAAIGLSGKALLRGRIAPGSVDFIGPRLLLFYTQEKGLSLSFSRDGELSPQPGAGQSAHGAGLPIVGSEKEINLTQTVTAAFDQARRHKSASSFLTRFGVRDAVVVFDQLGKQSSWKVPDFAIDLKHKKRESIIFGQGAISSVDGPWTFSFKSEQSTQQDSLAFTAIIKDLVPSSLVANFPGVPGIGLFKIPLSAKTSINLSATGELKGASATLDIAQGLVAVPWDKKRPVRIDQGKIEIRYDTASSTLNILPSRLSWDRSYATISGTFSPAPGQTGEPKIWQFDLKADDSLLEANEFGLPPMKVKKWIAQGTVDKEAGRIVLQKFVMELPQGMIEFAGTVVDAPGSPEVRLAGNFSSMPLAVLKQMWPKFLAGGAREWVGERVGAGQITGGSFEVDFKAGELERIAQGGEIPDAGLIVDLSATGLEIFYLPELPPVMTGDVTFEIRGQRVAFDVPHGWIVLPSGKKVSLAAGKFLVDDVRPDPQPSVVEFDAKGSAVAIMELLDHEPLGFVKEAGLKVGDITGRADGRFQLQLPLKNGLEFEEIRMQGEAVLRETRSTGSFGGVAIEGGTVNFNVSEKALEAKGDLAVNGIQSHLNWQRIFDAPPEKQPELRLSSVLDQAARAKLGFDLDHMVRGPVSAVVAVEQVPPKNRPRKVSVQADLARAELILSNVGWKKQPGRNAVLRFDLGKGIEGNTELQNFQIIGDDIAIDGWISFGADEKPNAFYFPDFSFNVITHMEVRGKLRDDKVWEVSAHGPAYDGRQLFRSLFSAGQLAEDEKPGPDEIAGVDLTARIGTVVGFFDTTANDVSVDLSKRKGKLVKLDARGVLSANAGVAARLVEGGQNERVLLAESDDAGAAFKLVGFYPNMESGQSSLRVTLDAQGYASKTGTLWARDFTVLGDRVVSEVVSNASDDPGTAGRRTESRRQRIPFNQLEVPFSVGGGKFILHDSYINGPQLGATLRGNVDFKSNYVDLGGTFVPLYGLNSALGSIPIIGNILVGRRGEGVVGITYSVKGPASDPRVLVNPLSIVTPGIFRQIFEFTGKTPDTMPGPAVTQPSVSPFDPYRADRN